MGKGKAFIIGCSLLLITISVSLSVCESSAEEPSYKALSPRGIKPEVKLFPLAPRVSDFRDKVVYVISQHVGDADIFLKKVAAELPKYLPGVKAVYQDKPSAYMTNDPELWDDTAKNGQAFVFGCAA